MRITSTAFSEGGTIPRRHTCDGEDASPPLAWSDVPADAVALALVVDDPDAPAGLWTHWSVWDVPATAEGLPGGVGPGAIPGGGLQGANSWGNARWQGPCPPRGIHRYRFRLFALDATLALPGGAAVEALHEGMDGHVLAEASLVGRYARSG